MVFMNDTTIFGHEEYLKSICEITKEINGMSVFDKDKSLYDSRITQSHQIKKDKYISGIEGCCAMHKHPSESVAYLEVLLQKWENNFKNHEKRYYQWQEEGIENRWISKWKQLLKTEYKNKDPHGLKTTMTHDFESELDKYFADFAFAPAYPEVINYIKDSILTFKQLMSHVFLSSDKGLTDNLKYKSQAFKDKLLSIVEQLRNEKWFINETPEHVTSILIKGGTPPIKWAGTPTDLVCFMNCL